MNDAANDELHVLRRRAYGPDADIQRDPVALDRLQRLEHADRTPDGEPVVDAQAPSDHASGATDMNMDPGGSAPEKTPVDPDVVRPPLLSQKSGWSRQRLAWTWAGSLAAAALLGAAATELGSALSRPGDAIQVGTLREKADFVWPSFLGTETDDARGYTDFLGLTAITTDRALSGAGTDTCMIIIKAADVDSVAGDGRIVPYACGTTTFPVAIPFRVTPDLPAELIERYPVGTELQFVLSASQPPLNELRIDVFTGPEP